MSPEVSTFIDEANWRFLAYDAAPSWDPPSTDADSRRKGCAWPVFLAGLHCDVHCLRSPLRMPTYISDVAEHRFWCCFDIDALFLTKHRLFPPPAVCRILEPTHLCLDRWADTRQRRGAQSTWGDDSR